jgi:DNA-binding IclR family transcriptional regulator
MTTTPIGHAERLILLLTAFAEGPDVMSVKELAEKLGLPQSTTHRLLESLVATGLIGRAPHRKYRIGTELFRLAAIVEDRFELVTKARPLMQQVVAACGETCLFALLTRSRSTYLLAEKCDSPSPLRFRFQLHQNLSLLWGSAGRAILAWLEMADIRRVLDEAEEAPASHERVPAYQDLLGTLAEIKQLGFALTKGQRSVPDAIGMAVPFFDDAGQVRGSLAVVVPDFRLDAGKQQLIVRHLSRSAAELSRTLGYVPQVRKISS